MSAPAWSIAPTDPAATACSGVPPKTVTVPASGRAKPRSMSIVVDFPAPFGPSSASVWPCAMSRSIPRTASMTAPDVRYVFFSPRSAIPVSALDGTELAAGLATRLADDEAVSHTDETAGERVLEDALTPAGAPQRLDCLATVYLRSASPTPLETLPEKHLRCRLGPLGERDPGCLGHSVIVGGGCRAAAADTGRGQPGCIHRAKRQADRSCFTVLRLTGSPRRDSTPA